MYGELEQAGDQWQIRFERRLAHPPEKVWRAITEPEHLEAWFPTTIEGERVPGAPLRFSFRKNEAPPFDGKLVVFDPPSLLEFTWGPDVLRIELAPDGDGTRLTLFDTFGELGKAARDAAGWHVCLAHLERSLSGSSEPIVSWKEVHAAYVTRFGPEASEIGPPAGPKEG